MKHIRIASLLVVAGMAGTCAASSLAQSAEAPKKVMASKTLSKNDREFMLKAAGGGLYEVEVSRLALQKAQSPDVKKYADMLVKHHTKANDELKVLATAKPLRLPSAMPDGKKAKMDALAKKSGAEFDRDYVTMVGVDDHRADIELFEEEIKTGRDTEVKAFAVRTLPVLKQHLAGAEAMARSGKFGDAPK